MNYVFFTEQADADLFGIYVHTYQTWGEKQAIKYTNLLRHAIEKIAANPTFPGTRDRTEVRPGYRSYHAQRHLIFYRSVERRIEIVRILHDSMDIRSHLPEP